MRLVFKSYLRRDGSFIIYLNNDRKVSVGISPEHGYGPSTKLTDGQKNLIREAPKAFLDAAKPFTGSIEAHEELKFECDSWTLLITDTANVGGMDVGEDGAYIVRDGRILRAGTWIGE